MTNSKYSDLTPYLRHITPGAADPTYSILKAHLFFEEILRDFLHASLPHPSALTGARLSFSQLLAVARSTARDVPPDNWHWQAISDLNRLRNLLAHNLEPAAMEQKIEAYVQYIVRATGRTLPAPAPEAALGQTAPPSGPRYLAVDMVNAALYSHTVTVLKLAPEEVFDRRTPEAKNNAHDAG